MIAMTDTLAALWHGIVALSSILIGLALSSMIVAVMAGVVRAVLIRITGQDERRRILDELIAEIDARIADTDRDTTDETTATDVAAERFILRDMRRWALSRRA